MPRFALTVIRHGETRLNKEKIIQGQGVDAPLSETGFWQAAAAGQFLSNVQFTHAFSSDLTRTKQTIHSILEKSRFCKDMPVKYDSRLRERVKMRGKDFFDFICQLILGKAGQRESCLPAAPGSCLESSLAEVFPVGKHGSLGTNPKGGALGLAASILVVSHGAYMRSLFSYFQSDLRCSLPGVRDKFELSSITPNTGISVFIIECGEAHAPSIQCVCMNLQEHLNGVTEKH
ncbi:fructose-2,6-bisphosphatase TIGAR isoform X2 [Mastomys coucha]|uniref:fructose-2,6-bisphosphatase TIGAR isoform X2 n=1 Tax=Mastomys coucha TaxID=35658 RepID=UPI001261BADF|nr:fructose-2,6-bisphosphatase TIGAR isoform X2 [Mastomys coucha]